MRFCQNLVEKERERQVALVRKEGMKKKKVLRRKETVEIFPDHSQEKSNPNRFYMTVI